MANILFLRLTMATNGDPVLVNVSQIKAVYKYFGKDTTVVDYAGTDDGYMEVLESVDSITRMIQGLNRI